MRIPSPRPERSGRPFATPRPARRGDRRIVAVLLAFAVVVAGCYSSGSSGGPKPADFTTIAGSLAAHGITIQHVISGDAGCQDSTLAPTAIGFDAHGLDQTSPVRVRLYTFRNGSVYTRLRSEVDTCARSYVSDPSAYATVDSSPYVAAGAGPWGSEFKAEFRKALQEAVPPDTSGP